MGPDTLPETPARKKRRITTKVVKDFKKEFDAPPSTLLNRSPSSQKCTPFRPMVMTWWLQRHPDAKILGGADWLEGLYNRLSDDLHLLDKEYLNELVIWHGEKESAEKESAE
jgi:hypothetical protein